MGISFDDRLGPFYLPQTKYEFDLFVRLVRRHRALKAHWMEDHWRPLTLLTCSFIWELLRDISIWFWPPLCKLRQVRSSTDFSKDVGANNIRSHLSMHKSDPNFTVVYWFIWQLNLLGTYDGVGGWTGCSTNATCENMDGSNTVSLTFY